MFSHIGLIIRETVKIFVIDELRKKSARCLYDQTDGGTSFFGRLYF